MAQQLDYTTSIASTLNYAIHGIHFGPHTTFSRHNHFTSKQIRRLNNIGGVDWTTGKSHHSIQRMPCKGSSHNSNLSLAMIVGLKMTHISLEHCITEIFSNVSSVC